MDYTLFKNSHAFHNYLLDNGYIDGSYKMRELMKIYHTHVKEKNNEKKKSLMRAYNAKTVFVPIDELDALVYSNN